MYYQDTDFQVVDRVVELAARMGHKPAQVALAWILAKPGVDAPIVGATKMYQLEDALIAPTIKLSKKNQISGRAVRTPSHFRTFVRGRTNDKGRMICHKTAWSFVLCHRWIMQIGFLTNCLRKRSLPK